MIEPAPWPVVAAHEGWFREVLGRLPEDDVDALLGAVREREKQAWVVAGRAVVLTELREGPKGLVMGITHCAGEGLDIWAGAIDGFEQLARAKGCVAIEATGRPGWARIGKPYGFRTKSVTLTKDLQHGRD